MSNTPRTDEFCKTAGGQYTYDITGLARSLERELSTCSAKFDLQQEQLDRNAGQIAALREQINWLLFELKVAADRLTDCQQTTISARDCIGRVEASLAKEEGK